MDTNANLLRLTGVKSEQLFRKYVQPTLVRRFEITIAIILLSIYYLLDVNGFLKTHFFLDEDTAHDNAKFFLGTVVVGVITFIYHNKEKTRAFESQNQEKQRELRTLNRAALVDLYRSVNDLQQEFKKIRRSLRAASYVNETRERLIERHDFEHHMAILEDCQLKAESLYRQVKVRSELFDLQSNQISDDIGTPMEVLLYSDSPGRIVRDNLESIKKYLRKAVRPYECNFAERRLLTPKELLVIKDCTLKEFVELTGDDKFSTIYKELFNPEELVRLNLLKLISELESPLKKIETKRFAHAPNKGGSAKPPCAPAASAS